jgi:DNA-binding response OmpR family regulator
MRRILIVEDDPTLGSLLVGRLREVGYDTLLAADGTEGLRLALERPPDLVILDLILPGMEGWEVCRRLREAGDTPILMLTARTDPADVVRGLELGADDYVRKPFEPAELEARVLALLRRSNGVAPSARTLYDDDVLSIDPARRLVTRYGAPVRLTPTEFRLLVYLAARPDQVVSHAELLSEVWGPAYAEDTSVLAVYVRYLREKLEDDPHNPDYVRTEWGVGYRFHADERAATEQRP